MTSGAFWCVCVSVCVDCRSLVLYSSPVEAGGTTQNLVPMLRLMTLHAPREFEGKFIAHTKGSWGELSSCEQVQLNLGKAEGADLGL